MRLYQFRSILFSGSLLFLLWYLQPLHVINNKLDRIKTGVKREQFSTTNQISSSSFTSSSETVSSAAKVENDDEKAVTESVPIVNISKADIESEVSEFLTENLQRKQDLEVQCKNFFNETKATGGYRRLVAKTVQSRKPRAQMFTVDAKRR